MIWTLLAWLISIEKAIGGKLSCFWMITDNINICKASINTEKEIPRTVRLWLKGNDHGFYTMMLGKILNYQPWTWHKTMQLIRE